jgi:DNA-binding MarR family transcriptional regulator
MVGSALGGVGGPPGNRGAAVVPTAARQPRSAGPAEGEQALVRPYCSSWSAGRAQVYPGRPKKLALVIGGQAFPALPNEIDGHAKAEADWPPRRTGVELLVAIKGHAGPEPPAIRDLAEYLLLQSQSAVGLVDRAEAVDVVCRRQDDKDARVVRVHLTEKGDRLVESLTTAHLTELYNLAEALNHLLQTIRLEGNPSGE